jgi:Ca-activated chloride channel homolog
MILITDGEANMGMDPDIARSVAKQAGITIYTIGIGDPKGTELYITDESGKKLYFRDDKGKPIVATLNEKSLRSIAESTGGKYFNVSDEKTLQSVFDDLSKMNREQITTTTLTVHPPLYTPFLVALAVCLIASMVLPVYVGARE